MSPTFLFATCIDPLVKDQIRLAGKEIMGYVGRIACCMAYADNLVVFAISIAVCSPLQQSSSFLNEWYRTGACRWHISSGRCMVSGIITYPCHTRPSFPNPGAAGYNIAYYQQVSDVFAWGVLLDTFITENCPRHMSIIQQPLEPSFTHACYRCSKAVFVQILATVVPTFLAQVVLTLRSSFFGGDCFVLITAE